MPTRGRPHLIARAFEKAPPTAPGAVVHDFDQANIYKDARAPWRSYAMDRKYLGPKLNALLRSFPDEPWYGIVNDDMQPVTPGWDIDLPKAAGPWGIAYADDCYHGRIGASVLGGELVRALGWLAPQGVDHFYIDNVHEQIAADLGVGVPCGHIKIPHLHFTMGGTPFDKTYEERPNPDACLRAFVKWKDEDWPALLTKVRTKMAHDLFKRERMLMRREQIAC